MNFVFSYVEKSVQYTFSVVCISIGRLGDNLSSGVLSLLFAENRSGVPRSFETFKKPPLELVPLIETWC